MSYHYRACGLGIGSPLLLPLSPANRGIDDIVIAAQASTAFEPAAPADATPERVWFDYPALGRFTMQGGRELIVPSIDNDSARWIAAIVLGTGLPHLCHQRGLMPLHAATVLLNGRAVAFGGPWGIGKSTMLDAFVRAGHRFMADDLCAVELPSDGATKAVAYPCGPWLKLSDEAARERNPGAARFKAPESKTWIDLTRQFHADPAPLTAVFLITDSAGDGPVRIERMTGIDALTAAPLLVSRWAQAAPSQGFGLMTKRAVALFGAVPLYRLHRPRVLDRLGEVVASLEGFMGTPRDRQRGHANGVTV